MAVIVESTGLSAVIGLLARCFNDNSVLEVWKFASRTATAFQVSEKYLTIGQIQRAVKEKRVNALISPFYDLCIHRIVVRIYFDYISHRTLAIRRYFQGRLFVFITVLRRNYVWIDGFPYHVKGFDGCQCLLAKFQGFFYACLISEYGSVSEARWFMRREAGIVACDPMLPLTVAAAHCIVDGHWHPTAYRPTIPSIWPLVKFLTLEENCTHAVIFTCKGVPCGCHLMKVTPRDFSKQIHISEVF